MDAGFGTVQRHARLHPQSCIAQRDRSLFFLLPRGTRLPDGLGVGEADGQVQQPQREQGMPVANACRGTAAVSGMLVSLHARAALGNMTCLCSSARCAAVARAVLPATSA
jgi:hypothetical protein